MKKLGLIGFPLSHSFSKKYFSEKFSKEKINNFSYENFPIEKIEDFQTLIQTNNELAGLNVTIPYKEKVIPFLNELDETAAKVGAVNTIKFIRKNNTLKLKGFNTDIYGFENSLNPLLEQFHKKALILGTGGASKAIKYVLQKLGIEYISASIENLKEKEIQYSDIDKKTIEEYQIIINATPLGTYPKNETYPPIPYGYIGENHILFDLVYNPEITSFMKFGIEKKAKVKNGLEMLHLQAERAWQIFNE